MKEHWSREEMSAWKLGIFYVNPRNPALWVPKRFSPGLTINLGHPKGRQVLAAVVTLPILIILASVLVTFFIIR